MYSFINRKNEENHICFSTTQYVCSVQNYYTLLTEQNEIQFNNQVRN